MYPGSSASPNTMSLISSRIVHSCSSFFGSESDEADVEGLLLLDCSHDVELVPFSSVPPGVEGGTQNLSVPLLDSLRSAIHC